MTGRRAKTKVEIVAGRVGTTFTQVPDWVLVAPISPQACALYAKLAMHLSVRSGDDKVWPGKENLGILMKVSRGDAIDPYLRELEELGAIEIGTSNRMPTHNIYTVHFTPPDDYPFAVTMQEFYARTEAEIERRKAAQREKTEKSRAKKKASGQVKEGSKPPVTVPGRLQGKPGAVTASGRLQVTGSGRKHVTVSGRLEQEEPELQEVEQPPPPSSDDDRPAAPAGAAEQEEVRNLSEEEVTSKAQAILTAALKTGLVDVPKASHPDGQQLRLLRGRIQGALRAGWTEANLIRELGQSYVGAVSVYAVMGKRLAAGPDGNPGSHPSALPVAPPAPRQPCETIDCDTGWVHIEASDARSGNETSVPCPTCLPAPFGRHIKDLRSRGFDVETFADLLAHFRATTAMLAHA